jgi:glycosyltransferase involved in cell wall biosynthesis
MQVSLEVPRFGEFVRQTSAVSSREVLRCLSIQRTHGGRLGQIMVREKLIANEQLFAILRRQANWVAKMRSHDIGQGGFPLETFSLSLCLPCYNEELSIGDVLLSATTVLPEFVGRFEVVVIDDGSTDGTATIVKSFAERDDRVRLIRHEVNRGYGAAVTTALRTARNDWVCFTDGDGQFNLLDLPQLIVNTVESDVAIGYRYRRADNFIRRLNAFGWQRLVRCVLGVQVRDLDCAFKLFPRWVIDRLELSAEGACISVQILAQCIRGGVTISEAPVNHFPRTAGKPTGANARVIAKAFRELSTMFKYRKMPPWPESEAQRKPIFATEPAASSISTDCPVLIEHI